MDDEGFESLATTFAHVMGRSGRVCRLQDAARACMSFLSYAARASRGLENSTMYGFHGKASYDKLKLDRRWDYREIQSYYAGTV